MAIARTSTLSVKSAGTGAATIDISGVADGSWMILVIVEGNTTTGITPPAWTTLLAATTIGSRRYRVLGRIKQSGDTCSISKAGSLALSAGLAYGTGADPVADWQVGTGNTRAGGAPSTSTTSVAPSITTGEANMLAIGIAVEATSAEDTTAPVVSGTGWNSWLYVTDTPAADVTNIEQIHITYKDMPSAGATGNMTVTYQNSQASNGGGIQIGITPAASNAAPTALFTHTETWLHTAVDGTTSSDSDGTISSYDWNWGDGTSHGSGSTATHDYAQAGTYTITLTVTDNGGATDTETHDVTAVASPKLFVGSGWGATAYVGANKAARAYLGSTLVKEWSYTVAQMLQESEIKVAWRGLGDTYAEMCLTGYAAAVAAGFKVLECSVNYSSDGVPVLIHDDTVDRVTNGTGTVVSKTWATLQALTVDVGTGGDRLRRLEEVLDLYARDYVIFIDDKTTSNTTAMLALLATYPEPQKHFVWKGFRGWTPAADVWTAAGYQSWGIYYDAEMGTAGAPHSSVSHFSMLGLNWDATSGQWADAVSIAAAGAKRLLGHVIHSAGNRTTALGLGATGVMTGIAV